MTRRFFMQMALLLVTTKEGFAILPIVIPAIIKVVAARFIITEMTIFAIEYIADRIVSEGLSLGESRQKKDGFSAKFKYGKMFFMFDKVGEVIMTVTSVNDYGSYVTVDIPKKSKKIMGKGYGLALYTLIAGATGKPIKRGSYQWSGGKKLWKQLDKTGKVKVIDGWEYFDPFDVW